MNTIWKSTGKAAASLRMAVLLSLSAALGLGLAACGSSSKPPAASPVTVHLYTNILTGKMIVHSGSPKYSPANMTVPAHSTVVLTIYNWDDGTAPLPSSSPYGAVTGGSETVNGSSVTSVPTANLSHTFTIPSLKINVPVPPAPTAASGSPKEPAVVVFTFHVGGSGSYTWHCMTPCGTAPGGMGGAMATPGFMEGTLTVA